jgi:hypothetical protein
LAAGAAAAGSSMPSAASLCSIALVTWFSSLAQRVQQQR